jgi:hypothetical protein
MAQRKGAVSFQLREFNRTGKLCIPLQHQAHRHRRAGLDARATPSPGWHAVCLQFQLLCIELDDPVVAGLSTLYQIGIEFLSVLETLVQHQRFGQALESRAQLCKCLSRRAQPPRATMRQCKRQQIGGLVFADQQDAQTIAVREVKRGVSNPHLSPKAIDAEVPMSHLCVVKQDDSAQTTSWAARSQNHGERRRTCAGHQCAAGQCLRVQTGASASSKVIRSKVENPVYSGSWLRRMMLNTSSP